MSDILDSTANGFNGTPLGGMNSGNLVNGRVGPALDFDGINNHIDLGDINETGQPVKANCIILDTDRWI